MKQFLQIFNLQSQVYSKLDKSFSTMISLILIATLIIDPQPAFRHSDLPPLPDVVRDETGFVIHVKFQIRASIKPLLGTLVLYTAQTHGPNQKPDVVYTKRTNKASELLEIEKKFLGKP